jgi:hypothetical protein
MSMLEAITSLNHSPSMLEAMTTMVFTPRIGATIFVFLLIGILAWAGVAAAAWLGPMSAHGTNVMHVGGDVLQVGPGKNFVFETDTKEKLAFVCSTGCRASLRHLQRHVKEKAHTDVYYIQGPDHELLVKDVD